MAGQGPPCGLDDDPDDGGRGRPGHSGRGAMTDPFSSEGSKAPPKPFTVEEGRRRVRSFVLRQGRFTPRSEEHTSELQSLMRISYALFCLKKKKTNSNPQSAVAPIQSAV